MVIPLFWLLGEYQIQICFEYNGDDGMGPCFLHHCALYLPLLEQSLPINTLVFCSQDMAHRSMVKELKRKDF